jgi:putative NADH-flavin reductase
MRIAVIGASGWLGGTFTGEALGRGHQVTAIGRDAAKLATIEGATPVVADIGDPEGLVRALE